MLLAESLGRPICQRLAAAVLVLVAVPVMLLGTVAPYANRLALGRVADTGTVTGRLYAISTAGSLVGTFASALLLIPLMGNIEPSWCSRSHLLWSPRRG